ncbi:CLAVATA3/ESR (CLE)-related protein 16-like [Fagus crenata]|jgi:hypothetical protein
MRVPSEGSRARGNTTTTTSSSAIFLLWVILIFTQISLCFAADHEETGWFIRSPPRRERFSETPLFHAPSSSISPGQAVATNGDSDTIYGDDKRVIHTGPNPLHN